ncbi:MAG: hypothetical protein ACRENE_17780 [Polyangiaceae bacterium]
MEGWPLPGGKRAALVLPAVLLSVNLLETVAVYKLRQHIRDVHVRSAFALLLYGAAFAIAAAWLSPWLQRALTASRSNSRRRAGTVGVLMFYAVAYGGLYYGYLRLETHGAAGLLPHAWR